MATEREDVEGVDVEELLAAIDEETKKHPGLADHFEAVNSQLTSRKWAELEVVEYAGYLLFADVILKRAKSGKFEDRKVMVRVPRDHEMRAARKRAREQFRDDGLDPKEDRDIFDKFENMVILAQSIRNNSEPYEPLEPNPLALEKQYDVMSLRQVWQKLEAYNALINPQPDLLTKTQFIGLVAAISEGRTIVPLDVISFSARASFVITMAVLLRNLLGSKFSSGSFEISTREDSPSTS